MPSFSARLAFWTLRRLASEEARTIVAGDLLEQMPRRSRAWLWYQVIGAVALGTVSSFRLHWVLAVRAVLTLGASHIVVDYLPMAILGPRYFSPWTFLLIVCGRNFSAGWVAGRTHRRVGGAVVIWIGFVVLAWSIPELTRLTMAAFSHQRYLPYLAYATLHAALACLATCLGGLTAFPAKATEIDEAALTVEG